MFPFRPPMLGVANDFTLASDIAENFNTTLYTGNGATQDIETGIDLVSNEGMIWSGQDSSSFPLQYNTFVGTGRYLTLGVATTDSPDTNKLTAFNSDGFSLGADTETNASGVDNVAWSFRRKTKFFDIIYYTGTGSTPVTIPHSLGTTPGFVGIKALNVIAPFYLWHRSLTSSAYHLDFSPNAETSGGDKFWFGNGTVPKPPDANNIYTTSSLNAVGKNYLVIAFAHDTDPDGMVQCGSYVGNSSTSGPTITLGWEPQFILIKMRNSTQPWVALDNVRGFDTNLKAFGNAWPPTFIPGAFATASSTGFQLTSTSTYTNQSGMTYVYMAIRKP